MNTRWTVVGLVLCFLGAIGAIARSWLITTMDSSELESMAHDVAYTIMLSAAIVILGASIALAALFWAKPKIQKSS
jgi:uncharacterized membrane protein YgdD (TMEM256/DUF423 family)